MRARTFTWCAALLGLGLAAIPDARGEVSAKLDANGQYAGMVIRYSLASKPRIWAGINTASRRPVNPTGDSLGDLAPTVVENPANHNWPMVVWSHPNGPDYDLIFSKWTNGGWSPAMFVQADNSTNEIEPRLEFSPTGRAFMIWRSNNGSESSIFFSMFLETHWLVPIRASNIEEIATNGNLWVESDLLVHITYETSSGPQTHVISIPQGDTITDDIDPKILGGIRIQ
jgi:hypothetical protein